MLRPPLPKRQDYVHSLHGDERPDPYFWMRERDSEDVVKHLNAENAYFEATLASTKTLQDELFREMKSRIKEEDSSPASPRDGYEYYTRTETGREYQIYCRRKKGGGNEEILLDVNALAQGLSYCDVGSLKVSPDHKRAAFSLDRVGRRLFSVLVKDLETGEISENELEGTGGNFEWAADNRTIFAVLKHPETLRSDRCMRYDYQTNRSEEIYFEADEIFGVGISKSLNGATLFLGSYSFDSSEVRLIDAHNPKAEPLIFAPREKKHEYSLMDGGDCYYIVTNWQAANFRVMSCPKKPTPKESWAEVVPHDPAVLVEGAICFEKHLVLEERFNGLSRIRVIRRDGGSSVGNLVSFPDPTYVTSTGSNLEYRSSVVRLVYSSPVQPATWYDSDLDSCELKVVKISEVPNFNRDNYVCERIWATAKDGTKIPISLIGPKNFRSRGPMPTLVYGYGSYGLNIEPAFRTSYLSLVDRGFLYAIAHIRGGSDLGRHWYEEGRMMNKMNTFTDFISCTEHLVDEKLAAKDKVFAMGGSAGGLLVGTAMNLRPDLYRGVVAQVPFVDALTTMLDPTIPLTTAEYEQWGNPNERAAYDYIKAYSPYDQVKAASYPHIYVETGYHDSQVQYWEPAKWVSRLRDFKTSSNVVIFRTNMEAGHGGASGRFERLKELAMEYAFILWALEQPRA